MSSRSALTDEELEDLVAEGQPIAVTGHGMTDLGLRRRRKEKAFLLMPEYHLFAIADGMGGHAAGEVASILTLETITDAFERNRFLDVEASDRPGSKKKRLVQVIEEANQVVLAMSKEIDAYQGMGSTTVILQFSTQRRLVFVANVGDSRCYRINDKDLDLLTVDHTLQQIGVLGKTSSLLSRAVGLESHIDVDVSVHRIEKGDVFLLCSDGLSRQLEDDEVRATILSESSLEEASKKLIAKAKSAGARDSITAVLIRVDEEEN